VFVVSVSIISESSLLLSLQGVGYVTNYLGVNMLFYPLHDKLSFKRWPDQPLGLFGWQGIVPCKRITMATTLVDVSLTKLLKISEVNLSGITL
jgi:uncharacterized membrane protein YheB (UPF0754 family)